MARAQSSRERCIWSRLAPTESLEMDPLRRGQFWRVCLQKRELLIHFSSWFVCTLLKLCHHQKDLCFKFWLHNNRKVLSGPSFLTQRRGPYQFQQWYHCMDHLNNGPGTWRLFFSKKNWDDEYECCFTTKKIHQSGISKGSCVLARGVWSSAIKCPGGNYMILCFAEYWVLGPF